MKSVLDIKPKSPAEVVELTQMVQATSQVLRNPSQQNLLAYNALADKAQGHPSKKWKRASNAITALACVMWALGLVFALGGFGTFGASTILGIGLLMASKFLIVVADLADRAGKRDGLSKNMQGLAYDLNTAKQSPRSR